ncbi:hypothetical protein [Marinomonas gallaica]|uniref:hypothetical protein n=1 Tax=Marinomonas gallaica TaxID=1806667 RepID=UPI000834EABF|nr:hypothetical protein [Marinomonas gallaica]
MGTETEKLQKEIKILLKKIGWSQAQLGRELYYEKSDADNDDELQQWQEKVKKQLSRSTTPAETLQAYLDFTLSHGDARVLQQVRGQPVKLGFISNSLTGEIAKLSKELDRQSNSGRSK